MCGVRIEAGARSPYYPIPLLRQGCALHLSFCTKTFAVYSARQTRAGKHITDHCMCSTPRVKGRNFQPSSARLHDSDKRSWTNDQPLDGPRGGPGVGAPCRGSGGPLDGGGKARPRRGPNAVGKKPNAVEKKPHGVEIKIIAEMSLPLNVHTCPRRSYFLVAPTRRHAPPHGRTRDTATPRAAALCKPRHESDELA